MLTRRGGRWRLNRDSRCSGSPLPCVRTSRSGSSTPQLQSSGATFCVGSSRRGASLLPLAGAWIETPLPSCRQRLRSSPLAIKSTSHTLIGVCGSPISCNEIEGDIAAPNPVPIFDDVRRHPIHLGRVALRACPRSVRSGLDLIAALSRGHEMLFCLRFRSTVTRSTFAPLELREPTEASDTDEAAAREKSLRRASTSDGRSAPGAAEAEGVAREDRSSASPWRHWIVQSNASPSACSSGATTGTGRFWGYSRDLYPVPGDLVRRIAAAAMPAHGASCGRWMAVVKFEVCPVNRSPRPAARLERSIAIFGSPFSSSTTASASITSSRTGSASAAAAIDGKREVQL